MKNARPTKERIKDVIDTVEEMNLPEGAYWAMIHELLDLDYGDVFEYIVEDPDFFGYEAAEGNE